MTFFLWCRARISSRLRILCFHSYFVEATSGFQEGLDVKKALTSADIISLLELEPLAGEGGFFRRTYSSVGKLDLISQLPTSPKPIRHLASAIYYLITGDSFSKLHRLPSDEIFHFYLGDPVRMCLVGPEENFEEITLGTNLFGGERPQVIVPAHTWQGAKLLPGGRFALLGTTMAPSFEFEDLELFDQKSSSFSHHTMNKIANYMG